jgi:hypothetical protein
MKKPELSSYKDSDFLSEGYPELLDKIRPLLEELITQLISLPEESSIAERELAFKTCIEGINNYEEEIETVERESILQAIYEIGTIVGLPADTEFAEAWRGDW